MKVLVVTDHFHPDLSSGGRLWTELSAALVEAGLKVRVLTNHSTYNTDAVAPPSEVHLGVHIRRLRTTQLDRKRLVGRTVNELTFCLAAFFATLRMTRPDVILSLSSPPFLAPFLAVVARLRRIPFVYVSYDVFPDIAVATGLLRPGAPPVWVFERLLRFALRRTSRIVVIGRCMEKVIREKLGGAQVPVDVIHNWADGTQLRPMAREGNQFFDRHPDLKDRFLVQYSGNMGRFQDFETVLAAAERLADDPRITFLLIGEGARRPWIIDQVEQRGLRNVKVLPFQPQELLVESLNAADVSLISLERGAEGLGVPSKLYPVLAVGKPVIALMGGHAEVARIVTDHSLGEVLPQGDVDGLCHAIQAIADDPEHQRAIGIEARRVFLDRFDKPIAMEAYRQTLELAVSPA